MVAGVARVQNGASTWQMIHTVSKWELATGWEHSQAWELEASSSAQGPLHLHRMLRLSVCMVAGIQEWESQKTGSF
jgi:hypothetical protein